MPRRSTGRRLSRSRLRLMSLLEAADLDVEIESVSPLGIGSAGLSARGNRDEDGTNSRVLLDDGGSVIYREYAVTDNMLNLYQSKESAVFETFASAGLPSPQVLASLPGDRAAGEAAATLLSDGGGEPLEEAFRSVPTRQRSALWAEVGARLRSLHDLDPGVAPILREPIYQRPWTEFVPYFLKSLEVAKRTRPDLVSAIDEIRGLRRDLTAFVESRPQSICCAYRYLPGMMLEPSGPEWRCVSWLNLGYYVSIRDPDQDLMLLVVAHREWTGDELPNAFFHAYGRPPDRLAEVLYEAALQLGRGAAYLRGKSRPGWGAPPNSTAIAALDRLPETVARIRELLSAR